MNKINRITTLTGIALSLCLIGHAAADENNVAASAMAQTATDPAQASEDRATDDMASFLSIVNRVLAEDEAPANLRNDVDDDQNLVTAADTDSTPTGNLHQRHLGLGFAHGMSNSDGQNRAAKPGANGAGPLTDTCHGDGHTGTYFSDGNGIGRIDCGDPSPSD